MKVKAFLISLILLIISLSYSPVWAETLMFAWEPPTTRVDGSPITNLAGYRLYWGTSSRNYTNSIVVYFCRACPQPSPDITENECLPLQPNTTYYFAVTAFDSDGNESDFSNEVFKTTRSATNPLGNCALTPSSSLCRVDGYDLIFVNKHLGKTILGAACTYENYQVWKQIQAADLDYNGIIDGVDKNIISANFGQTKTPCP